MPSPKSFRILETCNVRDDGRVFGRLNRKARAAAAARRRVRIVDFEGRADEFVGEVDKVLAVKEKEIMSV